MAKRILKTAIFIACEGKNTEPNYFERISEEVVDNSHLSITVHPDKNEKENHRTDGLGLVREAQNRAEEFDELYVVLDKDGYTQHNEVLALASQVVGGKTVNICLSSIAFEHWVLLHFERNKTGFAKSFDVIEHLRAKGYYPGYAKKFDTDIYTKIGGNTTQGIENAAWLRTFQETSHGVQPAHTYDAYTDVDKLVSRLIGSSPVIWKVMGQPFSLVDWQCNIQKNGIAAEVQITNNSKITAVFNTANLRDFFRAYDKNRTEINLTIKQTVLIDPGEQKTFLLDMDTPDAEELRVELTNNSRRAIIPFFDSFN